MITCRLIILFLLSLIVSVHAEEPGLRRTHNDVRIENAIGAIVLYNETQLRENRGSRNTLKLIELIEQQHASLERLSRSQRCEFFWTVAMTVELDAGFLYAFCELIKRECGEEFVARAKAVVEAPGDLDARRLALVKRHLAIVSKL